MKNNKVAAQNSPLKDNDSWQLYLQNLSRISKLLNEINYSDNQRIAREVAEHIQSTNTDIEEIIERFKANEPWEYIRGWAEFKGVKFKVTRDVLIPRVETEQLVDAVVTKVENLVIASDQKLNIIDAGTGSGNIIIGIASALKAKEYDINYYATEISESALQIAKTNAATLLPDLKINFALDYVLAKTINQIDFSRKTIIASNLPYVPTETIATLDPSVKEYEPHVALDGGIKGHELYKRLLDQLGPRINEVLMYWEIDAEIDSDVESLLHSYLIVDYEVIKDMYDKLRFISINF
ncbi:MAG: peptide chain release factor N(5)-glutamine methyltransferase [Candidatus Dojkabacteria bacterium]